MLRVSTSENMLAYSIASATEQGTLLRWRTMARRCKPRTRYSRCVCLLPRSQPMTANKGYPRQAFVRCGQRWAASHDALPSQGCVLHYLLLRNWIQVSGTCRASSCVANSSAVALRKGSVFVAISPPKATHSRRSKSDQTRKTRNLARTRTSLRPNG